MSEPYIGEIRFFPYSQYTPEGWLPCDGASYAVSQYQALYAVISNLFGGTQMKTFCVPNLAGKAAVGVDASGVHSPGCAVVGFKFGEEYVTLDDLNTPSHNHTLQRNKPVDGYNSQTSAPATNSDLGGLATSKTASLPVFTTTAPNDVLAQGTIGAFGASAPSPHENRQPFLVMRAAIAYNGIFPVSE